MSNDSKLKDQIFYIDPDDKIFLEQFCSLIQKNAAEFIRKIIHEEVLRIKAELASF